MEPYSLYSPNITPLANRDVIGIVTQVDRPGGNPARAEAWLRLAGCQRIFFVDACSGKGIPELLAYLEVPAVSIEGKGGEAHGAE